MSRVSFFLKPVLRASPSCSRVSQLDAMRLGGSVKEKGLSALSLVQSPPVLVSTGGGTASQQLSGAADLKWRGE